MTRALEGAQYKAGSLSIVVLIAELERFSLLRQLANEDSKKHGVG